MLYSGRVQHAAWLPDSKVATTTHRSTLAYFLIIIIMVVTYGYYVVNTHLVYPVHHVPL